MSRSDEVHSVMSDADTRVVLSMIPHGVWASTDDGEIAILVARNAHVLAGKVADYRFARAICTAMNRTLAQLVEPDSTSNTPCPSASTSP